MINMSTGAYKSAPQYIKNWLLDLFIHDPELQDLNWMTHARYVKETWNPPGATIFLNSKDHTEHSIGANGGQDFEYSLTLIVEAMITLSETSSEEGHLTYYAEKIEELIVANQQPASGVDVGDLQAIQARTVRTDYDAALMERESDFEAVELLLMQIDVDYVREVSLS